MTLRFRGGGERFRPRGREHHHSLKHLFQESGVVPWMRDRVPLLYRGDELAAIGDLWISADVDAAPASEPRWRVQWTEHPRRARAGTALTLAREPGLVGPRYFWYFAIPSPMHLTLNFDGRMIASLGSGVRPSRF